MANITISTEMAEKLLELYDNVVMADAHYQRCQSDNFRLHIKSVYQNAGISGAFTELDALIKADTAPQKGRKGVLSKD